MKSRSHSFSIIFVVALVICFCVSTTSAQSQAALAKAVVSNLYKAKPSPFFQTKHRILVDKYFTKVLADLIWKDAITSKGEVGAIDGDPLYNAQDTDIKKLVIGNAVLKGETGTVRVTFTNFGKKQAIDYSVRKTMKGWLIDDIVYDKDDSLRKWLEEAVIPH